MVGNCCGSLCRLEAPNDPAFDYMKATRLLVPVINKFQDPRAHLNVIYLLLLICNAGAKQKVLMGEMNAVEVKRFYLI